VVRPEERGTQTEVCATLETLTVIFWLQGWTVAGKFVYDVFPLNAVDHFVLAPNARNNPTNKVARRFVALMSRRQR
jgi:hypothetical protein